jgi:hypothetical protein
MAALTITASIASARDTQNQQSSATSTASERTIYQQPILTKGEQIVAAPTLIKSSTTIDNAPPRLDTVPGLARA